MSVPSPTLAMRRIDASALSTLSDADQVYADSASAPSVGSSPRSLSAGKGSFSEETQLAVKWDEAPSVRVKLLCSYGGRILPRPHDNQLRYVGGETRIVGVSRVITYGEFTAKLFKLFGASLAIKYQLPHEDLDALVSVTSQEDLDNMMEEYDRLQQAGHRCSRLRLFLFPPKLESQMSLSDLFESTQNRESWFVDALNGMPILPRVQSECSSIVSDQALDIRFGLDALDEWAAAINYASSTPERAAEKPPVSIAVFQLQGPTQTVSSPEFQVKTVSTALSAYAASPAVLSMVPSSVVDVAFKGQPTKQGTRVDNEVMHIPHADGEVQMPPMFTTTAYAFVHAADVSPDQRAAGTTDDDPANQLLAKSGHEQGPEAGCSAYKARTGSEEKANPLISVAPPMGQQLSEASMQLAKSNTSNKELESGIPRQEDRIIVSGEDERLAVIRDESSTEAVDAEELPVLGGKSDDRLGVDRRNKPEPSETQHSTTQFRAQDATIRASSSNTASPEASKIGDSVMMHQVSSHNTKESQAPGYPFSPAVEPSPLSRAAVILPDPDRLAFYSQEDEIASMSPTYATQGPVIHLPIAFSTPPAATGEAPPVCGKPAAQQAPASPPLSPPVSAVPPQTLVPPPSAQLAPVSNPVSPPLLVVPPQTQARRGQAPSPSPVPVTESSLAPATVYHSTAAYVEAGLPLRTAGTPMYIHTAQLQRYVSDPVAQQQRVPGSQRDYQAATANNVGPSMAALPSWYRGRPALVSNQQPQPIGSDRKPVGMRQAVTVPSPRPPFGPAQYIYNIEQRHTYPAARIPTAAIYDPTTGAYTLAPPNFVLTSPDIVPVASANPFVDKTGPISSSDVSSFARTP